MCLLGLKIHNSNTINLSNFQNSTGSIFKVSLHPMNPHEFVLLAKYSASMQIQERNDSDLVKNNCLFVGGKGQRVLNAVQMLAGPYRSKLGCINKHLTSSNLN